MTPKILIFSIACLAALHSAFSQSGSVSISTNSSETKNVHEKIFAHTDKEFYLAGEIIWFRLYYVEATNHTPLAMSKVAYVEVVDKDLKPVLQGKIELSGGAGSGSFYLPASLNSGIYRVRAYTQWMKNFNAEYFFEKSITIINSLRPLEIQSSPESTYEAGFFPEGGDLVENIESRLAFKICDRFGKGIDYSGYVLSQDNDTITEFRPVKFGIGSILFTPKAGSVYRAMVNLADTVLTIELPKAKERGYVMTVTNEDNGRVRVSVKTNEAAARAVTLLIHSRQAVKFSAEGFVSNGAAEFAIDRKTFSEGVSQITVLNDLKKPVAERLFFVQPTSGLMISEQVGSRDYAPRSKVAVQLSSKDEQGKSTTTGCLLLCTNLMQ